MPEVPPPQHAASSSENKTSLSTPAAAAAAGTQPALAPAPAKSSDVPWYLLAVGLGALNGFIEVALSDLLLTSFFALFFCLILGLLRPPKPWRWTLIVCGSIPLSRLFAADVLHIYTERAQIYEAFTAFITGNAGAYVGSLGRRRLDDLWGMIKSGK